MQLSEDQQLAILSCSLCAMVALAVAMGWV